MVKQLQPDISDYPADVIGGTDLFSVNPYIIANQHTAGSKAPIFRVIDTGRRYSYCKLEMTSTTQKTLKTTVQETSARKGS